MRVVREPDVARFLEKVGTQLAEGPAENNLTLGLLTDLARAGMVPGTDGQPVPPVLLVVESTRGVEAAALQTPPRALIVSRATDEATEAMVAFVRAANLPISGVIGPDTTAERFAARWSAQTGRAAFLRTIERSYELTRVQPPRHCPGALRDATEADEELLAVWSDAFHRQEGLHPIDDHLAFVRGKISARQLFVWEDGVPVSMAAWSGRTAQGVRINYVYTPPERRRKGYASASVAALCQRLLDAGSPRCFLFADAKNPTSNRIYQVLGFGWVCDFRVYDFPAR